MDQKLITPGVKYWDGKRMRGVPLILKIFLDQKSFELLLESEIYVKLQH